jgi:hypothetical protein
VVSSLLGRLITSPFAFGLAGVYDFLAFFGVWAGHAALTRARARRRAPGSG